MQEWSKTTMERKLADNNVPPDLARIFNDGQHLYEIKQKSFRDLIGFVVGPEVHVSVVKLFWNTVQSLKLSEPPRKVCRDDPTRRQLANDWAT